MAESAASRARDERNDAACGGFPRPVSLNGLSSVDVRLTTGVKLRGPEGAQRLRATSVSHAELDEKVGMPRRPE